MGGTHVDTDSPEPDTEGGGGIRTGASSLGGGGKEEPLTPPHTPLEEERTRPNPVSIF